jgi:hypothetical protein
MAGSVATCCYKNAGLRSGPGKRAARTASGKGDMTRSLLIQPAGIAVAITLATAACTPTVKVQAPDKPIEINLNVKIEQEVRIKVDRELDSIIANNPDLF